MLCRRGNGTNAKCRPSPETSDLKRLLECDVKSSQESGLPDIARLSVEGIRGALANARARQLQTPSAQALPFELTNMLFTSAVSRWGLDNRYANIKDAIMTLRSSDPRERFVAQRALETYVGLAILNMTVETLPLSEEVMTVRQLLSRNRLASDPRALEHVQDIQAILATQ